MKSTARKVLIGDRNAEVAAALVEQFKTNGFTTVVCQDGTQANLRVDSETFDVIVLNSKLGGMSGVQVAATSRTSTANKNSVVILVVNSEERDAIERSRQIGVTACLIAPVSPSEILKVALNAVPANASEGAYDVRLINAFVASVNGIFLAYFGVEPVIGKAIVKKNQRAVGHMSTLIDFNGNGIRGSLAISFDKNFLVALTLKMLPGSPEDPTEESLADLAGEMGNQICGAIKLNIGKLGLKVMIGLPKVVMGKDHVILHVVKNPTLLLPVSYGKDLCTVEFCMTKVADEAIEEVKTDDAAGGDILLF